MNTKGSYECTCAPGFSLLQSNNQTCRATGANEPLLLHAPTRSISWLTLRRVYKKGVISISYQVNLMGLSYAGDNIYWTDTLGNILKSKIDIQVKIGIGQNNIAF